MKKLLRCKACGYILEENKLKNVCPACGVPAKAFEPFEERVSKKRRMLLNFHIHPIIVHFPQSFSIFFLACLVITFIIPKEFKEYFFSTARVIALFLPLSILGGLGSGLFDGKIRFKKIKRLALIRKIIISSIFFILSLVISILTLGYGFQNTLILIIILVSSVLTMVCAALLGRIGDKLMLAILPG